MSERADLGEGPERRTSAAELARREAAEAEQRRAEEQAERIERREAEVSRAEREAAEVQRPEASEVRQKRTVEDRQLEGRERATEDFTPLLPESDTAGYQQRWESIQTRFVDAPRESVGDADALVSEVIQRLSSRFAEEREQLEGRWRSGSEVSTEELRQLLRRYRSFFHRLLSASIGRGQ